MAATCLPTFQCVSQVSEKKQSVALAQVTPSLDYGYGTTDAPTVRVGSQEWFGKNLNVSHFANGDPIPEVKNLKEWKSAAENKQPAWCYFSDRVANERIYGKLYNWYAVNDPRGLAPRGWHVPIDEEWTNLFHLLGSRNDTVNHHWDYFTTEAIRTLLKPAGNGMNPSGTPAFGDDYGFRLHEGTFMVDINGHWWSSSDSTSEEALACIINYDYGGYGYVFGIKQNKAFGLSVRCLKD